MMFFKMRKRKNTIAVKRVFPYVDSQLTVLFTEACGYQFGYCEMLSSRISIFEIFEADEI